MRTVRAEAHKTVGIFLGAIATVGFGMGWLIGELIYRHRPHGRGY